MQSNGSATSSTQDTSPTASLMIVPSWMSPLPTSLDSDSAISLLASVFGLTPSVARACRMTLIYGPAAAPANLSARQAQEQGWMTSGISGRISTTSSERAALHSSWENRLRAKTQTLGSTLYKMTWKPWDTGSGRVRSRLRASVLPTSATDFIGWPTPTTQANTHCYGADRTIQLKTYGASRLADWQDQWPVGTKANLAGWNEGEPGRLAHAGHDHDAGEVPASSCRQPQAIGPADQPSGCGVSSSARPGPANGFWRSADWLACRDGKWRPVEPGTFPLAHGAAARVGRLRAYGNAINAEAARVFIESVMC